MIPQQTQVGDLVWDDRGFLCRVTSVVGGVIISEVVKGRREMNHYAATYVNSMLRKGSNMLNHFAVKMKPEDMYAMICGGNEHMLSLFSKVANYMGRANFHQEVSLPVVLDGKAMPVSFTVAMQACDMYPRYLMPAHPAMVTPESMFHEIIKPAVVMAQEWAITANLFDQFKPRLNSDQLVYVLPWLKDLARDALVALKSDESWRFTSEHNIGYMTTARQATMTATLERLANPRHAGSVPALLPGIAQACRLGEKLFTQYRMLKDRDDPALGGTYAVVSVSDKLLPDWYVQSMQSVIANWEESEMERRMQRRTR